MKPRVWFTIGVVLTLILVACLYTYPLAFTMSWRLPGFTQTDTYQAVWNIWHLKKTVTSLPDLFSLTTRYIFYPQNPPLFLHNYILTSGLMSLPLQLFFSPLVSINLIVFIKFLLTGLGMYFLIFYYTRSALSAFWAAITLAFCPYVLMQSCYFLHFSSIWFFPWFIYFFWRFMKSGKRLPGVSAAIVYTLCLFEDQTYFIFLSIIGVFIAVFLSRGKRNVSRREFSGNIVFSVALFIALGSWYLAGLLGNALGARAAFVAWPDTAIDYFSLHPSGLLRPSQLLAVYRAIPFITTPMVHITNVFVGYVPLFLAGMALIRFARIPTHKQKVVMFWAITGVFFYLMASGPKLFGDNGFLNRFAPYNIFCVGPLRQLRIPARFSLVTIISVYILAAFGIEQCMKMKRIFFKNAVAVGIFLVLLQIVEFLPMPYPLLDLPTPAVYADLAHRDTGTPVLVLPLGWQTSYKTIGRFEKEIQFFQTVHGHPIFQGQIARIDDKYLDYYTSQPGFRYLIEADKRPPTPEEIVDVRRILKKYNIKNVVVHTKYFSARSLAALSAALSLPLRTL